MIAPTLDPQSEEAVIGFILDGHGTEKIRQTKPINETWFQMENFRILWNESRLIESSGKNVNTITLTDALQSKGLLEKAGGREATTPASARDLVITWGVVESALEKLERCRLSRIRETLRKDWQSGAVTDKEAIAALEELSCSGMTDKLADRRFDVMRPPEKAVPIISLAGIPISTAGNITAIMGQAKTGKSAVVGAILASLIDGRRHLSVEANPEIAARGVIHFDTEQSRYDHHQIVRRAMWRAGVDNLPPWFNSYSLADVPTNERRSLLSAEIARRSKESDGVRVVIIDGVADLCHDPNDPLEAFELVDELHQLSIRFNCTIVCVLHHNPGGEKGRGHLGSQLERKVESLVSLEKDKDGVVTVYSPYLRHGFLPKNDGPRIGWDEEECCFVELEKSKREVKAAQKAEEYLEKNRELAAVILKEGPKSYSSCVTALMQLRGKSKPTAERDIKKMQSFGIIKKNLLGDYELADDENKIA